MDYFCQSSKESTRAFLIKFKHGNQHFLWIWQHKMSPCPGEIFFIFDRIWLNNYSKHVALMNGRNCSEGMCVTIFFWHVMVLWHQKSIWNKGIFWWNKLFLLYETFPVKMATGYVTMFRGNIVYIYHCPSKK